MQTLALLGLVERTDDLLLSSPIFETGSSCQSLKWPVPEWLPSPAGCELADNLFPFLFLLLRLCLLLTTVVGMGGVTIEVLPCMLSTLLHSKLSSDVPAVYNQQTVIAKAVHRVH